MRRIFETGNVLANKRSIAVTFDSREDLTTNPRVLNFTVFLPAETTTVLFLFNNSHDGCDEEEELT